MCAGICFMKGRIGFHRDRGEIINGARTGHALFYFGNAVGKFGRRFGEFGTIVTPWTEQHSEKCMRA
jgi:hypothetical protein